MAFSLSRPSLALRLIISAAVSSVTILLIAAFVLSSLYRSAAEAEFDERLNVYLHALLADVANPDDDARNSPGQLSDPNFDYSFSGWYWQITRIDGALYDIRASRSLSTAHLPRLADQGVEANLGGLRRGYVEGPDHRVLRMDERIIDVEDVGIFLVQVAAPTEIIDQKIKKFQMSLAITFFVLAVVLVAMGALQVRFGLAPLRRLQQGVSAIRRGEQDHIEGVFAKDLAPLAGELNMLVEANRAVVERARTQVGNLAHALKTPLSVINNEYDVDAQRYGAKIREQARLMAGQVSYYLDRARMAARAGSFGLSVEILPVLEAMVRTFTKIYGDKTFEFDAQSCVGVKFAGEKQDFEEMLGNLLDNAGKWARSHVYIYLEMPRQEGPRPSFILAIEDDGPGLADHLRQTALKRGKRLDETKPGSGLGLSIVVELSELYGGTFRLEDSAHGGLRACLQLLLAS